MIALLTGKLVEKGTNSVIVEAGGVGYEVTIPLTTFYDLGDIGSEVRLRIYTHVREDAIQLYGFGTASERELFLKLISVQGFGTKSGITMLSGMSADEIIAAVRAGNIERLVSIPGVGRKTAERLIVELRDKVGELAAAASIAGQGSGSADGTSNTVLDDALSALVNLGYQKNAAEKALHNSLQEGTEVNVQKLLRAALQRLAK
jgi:holliday junction DNA helicase RuvA